MRIGVPVSYRGSINSHYYERLLAASPGYEGEVREEVRSLVPRTAVDEVIKDPYVLDFLGLPEDNKFVEKDLKHRYD